MEDWYRSGSGPAAERLGLRRSGRHWRGRCPVCERDAFSLTESGPKLLVHCFAGCEPRDLLAALAKHEIATGPALADRTTRRRIETRTPVAVKDWSPPAEDIWSRGVPMHGTLVETYLAARRCLVPSSGDIRFLPAHAWGPFACMMARITDAITAQPITLHFTRLAADGGGKAHCDRPKRLLAGHRKSGGVIRLTEDADVTLSLGLAEGIETALSVMADGWAPVWATVDAGNMTSFPLLAGIESLTLFADNDSTGAGKRAADSCAARWREGGRETCIVMPTGIDTDWNDPDWNHPEEAKGEAA